VKYTRKALLGVVAVDTGHLMVADPHYLFGGQVFPERGGENRAVFWGRDAGRMCELLRDRFGVKPEVMEDGACRVALPGRTAEEAAEAIKCLAQEQGLLVLSMPWTGSALDRAYEACAGRDRMKVRRALRCAECGLALRRGPGRWQKCYLCGAPLCRHLSSTTRARLRGLWGRAPRERPSLFPNWGDESCWERHLRRHMEGDWQEGAEAHWPAI